MTDDRPNDDNSAATCGVGRPVGVFMLVSALTFGLLGTNPAARAAAPRSTVSAPRAVSPATSVTGLESFESATKRSPKDAKAWISLAGAAVRKAYETADPSYYPRAASALRTARSLTASNTPELLSAEASLHLARHDFAAAHGAATKALALQPNDFDARLALVDAQVELGRYDQANANVERLVDQRPGVASLARLSYLRQLGGDLLGAEATMRAAIAAAGSPLDRSVAQAYLGDVLLERGRVAAAQRAYDAALVGNPRSAVALLGVARIQASAGRVTAALATLTTLTDRVPVPAAFGQRADIARAVGDRTAARNADQLVDASIALFRANGAVVDSELAGLLADRGPSSSTAAVAAAKAAYAERRTIFTADAMAWALHQAGRDRDAMPYAREAVATDVGVASVRWHAAAVFAAVGRTEEARSQLSAAMTNRWFSPSQQPAMQALATKLGVRP